MRTTVGKHAQVMWQVGSDDSIAEPAIVCVNYFGSGVIELQQKNSTILINYEDIPELCAMMKTVKGMQED